MIHFSFYICYNWIKCKLTNMYIAITSELSCIRRFNRFGYCFYNWKASPQQFAMNIPFAIYILSPAIASYTVKEKNENFFSCRGIFLSEAWRKPAGLMYCSQSLIKSLVMYSHVLLQGVFGVYGISRFFHTGDESRRGAD